MSEKKYVVAQWTTFKELHFIGNTPAIADIPTITPSIYFAELFALDEAEKMCEKMNKMYKCADCWQVMDTWRAAVDSLRELGDRISYMEKFLKERGVQKELGVQRNRPITCPCCGKRVLYCLDEDNDEYLCPNTDCGMKIRRAWFEKYLAETEGER